MMSKFRFKRLIKRESKESCTEVDIPKGYSVEESIEQIGLIREGKLPKKTWDMFLKERSVDG